MAENFGCVTMIEIVVTGDKVTDTMLKTLERLLYERVGWADAVVSPFARSDRRRSMSTQTKQAA